MPCLQLCLSTTDNSRKIAVSRISLIICLKLNNFESNLCTMYTRKCIMGCPPGQQLHVVPRDPERRAEWCRILRISPRIKRIYVCSTHISECYLFGNRLSKFAIPNPPESQKPHIAPVESSMFNRIHTDEENITQRTISRTNKTIDDVYNSTIVFPKEFGNLNVEETECQNYINEEEINVNNVEESTQSNPNLSNFLEDNTDESPPPENLAEVEDFEIRKGSTDDMIIKGRFVQTNDYLVVTYTPPRKWTLQQQVKILDDKCEEQLRKIIALNIDVYRLQQKLKKHEMLLTQFRKLQATNRYLYAQLKMYKLKEKGLKKRKNKRRLKLQENEN